MPTFVALLRGINVGAQKKIKMADLKQVYESLGYANVQTYVQSGNVVFDASSGDANKAAAEQEAAIQKHFGFDVPVIVVSPAELASIVERNPFKGAKSEDHTKLLVTFLSDAPSADGIEALKAVPTNDELVVDGKAVYLHVPGGYGESKLSNTVVEKKLKVTGTTRNWRTIQTLIEMAASK